MNPIEHINWRVLREQKRWLEQYELKYDEAGGLLCLIDALQDYAVDVLGLTEEQIFGKQEIEE